MRLAGELGDDGAGQRIPVRQNGAGLDGLVRLDRQHSAVRHLVTLALAAMFILNHDFAGARNHDQLGLAIGHIAHRGIKADHAVGLGFHAGGDRCTRRCTTDVEGTHG